MKTKDKKSKQYKIRQEGQKSKRVNVSLPPGVIKELDDLAKEAHMSRSGVITFLTLFASQFKEEGIRETLQKGVKATMKEVLK